MATENTKNTLQKVVRPDVDLMRDTKNDQVFADKKKYLLRYISTNREGYKMSFEWGDNILDLDVVPTAAIPGDIFGPTSMVLHYANFRTSGKTFTSLEEMKYIFSVIATCLEAFGQPTKNIEKYHSQDCAHTVTIIASNAKKLLPIAIANSLTSNEWGGIL